MKKILLSISILLISICGFTQETKKEQDQIKTKIDLFSSKTGIITKFIDFTLPKLNDKYSEAKTRVRKITNGITTGYFYQIIKDGKYDDITASIEYTDLLEVIKALKNLKLESEKDLLSDVDYLENKFTTVDGFYIGYYISSKKIVWFLRLEKYGSENTLYFDNSTLIESSFNEAKEKIELLKK